MQITKINYSYNTFQHKQNNVQDIHFGANPLKIFKKPSKTAVSMIERFYEDVPNFLQVADSKVEKYADHKRPKRMHFFYDMAKKLNDETFNSQTTLPENRLEILDEIYETVKVPNGFHERIIDSSTYNFADTVAIFKMAAETPENFNILRQLTKLKDAKSQNLDFTVEELTQIVQLPNSEKLSTNFQDFKSYIMLNRENPDFIEQLGKELERETPSFNVEEMNETLKIRSAQNNVRLFRNVPDEIFRGNMNEYGLNLFTTQAYSNDYIIRDAQNMGKEDYDFISYLLKTTTEDNVGRRKEFFQEYMGVRTEGNNYDSISAFFDKLDKDKNYRKIFDAISEKRVFSSHPISELMYYVDSLGSDVVAKHLNNFERIVRTNNFGEREPNNILKALQQNINNKYYLTPQEKRGLEDKEDYMRYSFFGNTKANLFKLKNKLKYGLLPKIFGTNKEQPLKTQISYEVYRSQFEKLENPIQEVVEETPVIQQIAQKEEAPIKTITELAQEDEPIITKAVSTSEQPKVVKKSKFPIRREYTPRQLKIQGEALEIVRSRMKSAKQIAEQSRDYTITATRMRNKYLNKIFDHIAETRSQQRKAGIKRPTVSNEDALRTYQFINGKNKKMFLEMLKARDEQGNLKYDIKQIGDALDKFNIEQNLLKLQKQKWYQRMKAKEEQRKFSLSA